MYTVIHEDAYWRIESNGIQKDDFELYKWENSFFRVTYLSTFDMYLDDDRVAYIEMNGEYYFFYKQYDSVLIEVSDIVRSYQGGAFAFSCINSGLSFSKQAKFVDGAFPSEFNSPHLPGVINIVRDGLPFYISQPRESYAYSVASGWSLFSNNIIGTNQPTNEHEVSASGITVIREGSEKVIPINEESGDYGFASRSVSMIGGELYRLTVKGSSDEAEPGSSLRVAFFNYALGFSHELTVNGESYIDVVAPATGSYSIVSFYYPTASSDPNYFVTVYYYKLSKLAQVETLINNIECSRNKMLLEWRGSNGMLKSWYFDNIGSEKGTSKTIDVQTLDSTYNTYSNKLTSITLRSVNADRLTQEYLSDIVMTDGVFAYLEGTEASRTRVQVSESRFVVTSNERDIVLKINVNKYDTI